MSQYKVTLIPASRSACNGASSKPARCRPGSLTSSARSAPSSRRSALRRKAPPISQITRGAVLKVNIYPARTLPRSMRHSASTKSAEWMSSDSEISAHSPCWPSWAITSLSRRESIGATPSNGSSRINRRLPGISARAEAASFLLATRQLHRAPVSKLGDLRDEAVDPFQTFSAAR